MDAAEFGKKIMMLRKQKGMTQTKLAEQINVSNKTISRWETGEGFPEISLLKPLAKALGTTVDELLGDEEASSEEQTKEKPKHHFFDFLGKESDYEEVPIDITALKEFVVETLEALKSGKLFFVLYILIMTRILLPAGSTYSDVMNDVECQLARAVVCKYLLILGITVAVMLGVQIRQWRKGYLDLFSAIGNSIALVVFGVGYFISYRDRRKVGFWNCEYFSVNRILMLKVNGIVLMLVTLMYLIVAVKNWKRVICKLKSFWNSLVIFNKISFVCLGICTVVMFWSICKVFLIFLIRIYTAEESLSILSMFDVVSINMISPYVCNLGVFSSILGLIIGLLGGYKKQTKGSIFFAITCYVGRVAFVWIAMLLSSFLTFIFFH